MDIAKMKELENTQVVKDFKDALYDFSYIDKIDGDVSGTITLTAVFEYDVAEYVEWEPDGDEGDGYIPSHTIDRYTDDLRSDLDVYQSEFEEDHPGYTFEFDECIEYDYPDLGYTVIKGDYWTPDDIEYDEEPILSLYVDIKIIKKGE